MIETILEAMTNQFQTTEEIASQITLNSRSMAWRVMIVAYWLPKAQQLGKVQSCPSGSRESEFVSMWKKKP